MQTWSQLEPLTEEQCRALGEFVSHVLPPEGGRNWKRDNELEHVHAVVNRWMKKLYGFHISPADLFLVFEQGAYLIKRISLSECPDDVLTEAVHRSFAPYEALNAWRLHINVNTLTVHLLNEQNRLLPGRAPKVKLLAQGKLFERILRLAELELQRAA